MRTLILTAAIVALSGCSKLGHDSDYMPYDLKGMNAYVYDTDDHEYFAGFSGGGVRAGRGPAACQRDR